METLAGPVRAKGAIRRIADDPSVCPEALRIWVGQAEIDGGTRPGTTGEDAERIGELEAENRELRKANAILRNASVCPSRRSAGARPADLPVRRLP